VSLDPVSLDRDSEQGGVLIGMMMFGVLAAFVVLALCGRVVGEYRAVEDSLAATRAYWAAVGLGNYVLSRTKIAGVCGPKGCPALQTDYSPPENTFAGEINDMQHWYYMDIGVNYMMQLTYSVCQDNATPVGAVGEVVVRTTFYGNGGVPPAAPPCPAAPVAGTLLPPCAKPASPDPKTIEALRSLTAMRPVELRFCLVADGVATCGKGPAAGTPGGAQLITSVHRPAC